MLFSSSSHVWCRFRKSPLSFPSPVPNLTCLIGLSSLICYFSSIIHVFHENFFVSPFSNLCIRHNILLPLPVHLLFCTSRHRLPFCLSLPLKPITCNNHTHFHILPSAVSPRRPWAAGCWLASVLMIRRSRTLALGINGLCRTTTETPWHIHAHVHRCHVR